MINVYLLRHSNAEDHPPQGERGDAARRLTPEGIEKAQVIGQAMRRMKLKFDLVLSSPAARARQTAERVVAELDPQPPLEFHEGLWIGGDLRPVMSRLNQSPRPPQEVLLVGHEPDLGRMVSLWLAGGEPLSLIFKKGGLCKLSATRILPGQCATLEWHLTPTQLRWIAQTLP